MSEMEKRCIVSRQRVGFLIGKQSANLTEGIPLFVENVVFMGFIL